MVKSLISKDIVVFIASHIKSEEQYNLLVKCIISLFVQTIHKDIYVSLSFEDNKNVNEKINKIKNCLQKYSNNYYYIIIHEKQKSQMQHYWYLTKNFASKYELIMFCDDDDTYHSERIEYFKFGLDQIKKEKKNLRYIQETPKNINTEYFHFAIPAKTLFVFFNVFIINNKKYLLKHKFSDMFLLYFIQFFNCKNKKYYHLMINKHLYNYNTNNKNSICSKIKQFNNKTLNSNIHKEYIMDNMILFNIKPYINDSNMYNTNKILSIKYNLDKDKYFKNVLNDIDEVKKLLYVYT